MTDCNSPRQPTVWVDADACPVVIRDILIKAALRTKIPLVFVANHHLPIPKTPTIKMQLVSSGFDVADDAIAKAAVAGDLVVSSDIPLVAELIEKGVTVISPRGEQFSADSIKAKLTMRDFMDTMRSSGIHTKGAAPASQSDRQQFANALDRYLSKCQRAR